MLFIKSKEGSMQPFPKKITEKSDATLSHVSTRFIYTNPAPMTQTPGEDSLSIFQISRVRLANSVQTTLSEIHYFCSKYRERPLPLLHTQITESILCAVNKEKYA
jgi:hypothetical protein